MTEQIEAWYVDEGGKERLEAFVAKADTYRVLARGESADSGALSIEETTKKEQQVRLNDNLERLHG